MKRRLLYLILPVITLILEILPYGAVCVFATSSTERIRQTYSYFDLLPFGYANFAPFLTAVITCVILVILIFFCITGNPKVAAAVKKILLVAVIISLVPLLYGIAYFSLVGGFITLSLASELLLLHFSKV